MHMMLLSQLAGIHEMLHRHGPCALLSLEQGRTFLFVDFPETIKVKKLEKYVGPLWALVRYCTLPTWYCVTPALTLSLAF